MVRAFSVAVVLGATIAVSACGGDGNSSDDFRSQLDAYCVERSQASLDAQDALGGPRAAKDFEDSVAQTEATLPVTQATTKGLADFEPPEDLKKEFDSFVAARQKAASAGEDALAAGQDGDEAAYQAALGDNGKAQKEASSAAEAMGLVACARKLQPEDEDRVRALVEEVETQSDTSQCTELFTENYVERSFGAAAGDPIDDPLKACEQFQGDLAPSDLAKSVEIATVTGTEPSATVEVTPSGGQNDGVALTYSLVKEGEDWRVNDIAAIAPA
jgi:hypothetical protein